MNSVAQRFFSFLRLVAALFLFFGIVFIPFPFTLINFQQAITQFVFGPPIKFTATVVLHVPIKNTTVSSDSITMYLLLLILLLLSITIALLLFSFKKLQRYLPRVLNFIYLVCCYYLALLLLKYGLDKIFKGQFYLPEPNTLYTPMGQLDKDILYWSAMGTSRLFNIVSGSVEVATAALLFFRRTRMAGSLLAVIVLTQVTVINFSFDISVKALSLFLLFIALYLLQAYYKRLAVFFFNKKGNSLPVAASQYFVPFKYSIAGLFPRFLFCGLFLLEAGYPFFKNNNFNDDAAQRPYLHGAYEVQQQVNGSDTITAANAGFKRLFIHRNGYLIFQKHDDLMQDFKLAYDKEKNTCMLVDYKLNQTAVYIAYSSIDSIITVTCTIRYKPVKIIAKAINWKQLPLLRKGFHWVAD